MTMIRNLTPHPITVRVAVDARDLYLAELAAERAYGRASVEFALACEESARGDLSFAPDPAGPARIASLPGVDVTPTGCPCPVISAPTWGAVEGLPAPVDGVILIVSALVAARCSDRDDVVSPGTGPLDGAVRDAHGRVVAVTRLVRASARRDRVYCEGWLSHRHGADGEPCLVGAREVAK